MEHSDFMRLAIEKTKKGIAAGQTPFGCCIVKEGKVVSCEHNVVWATTDITAHAEVNAIRVACRQLKTIDLSGCMLYTTCEPCPMCFAACHWARIDTIFYGATIADAHKAGFHELTISCVDMKQLGQSEVTIKSGVLQAECVVLFEEWKRAAGQVY
jgi:guanine deaminase